MNNLERTFRRLFPGEAVDTIETTKELMPNELIAQSLIHLRDELWANGHGTSESKYHEVFLKINSCLYRGYKL